MSKAVKQQPNVDQEEVIVEQARRIRALHAIISRPDLSFDQQIDEALRLGCELLGTEIGKVGRQDPENNASEFLNTIVRSDLPARRGIVLPLDKTFCQVTFSSPEAIAISHVAESEFKDHPAAQFLGMQSYIGCTIHVHGKKFGTVNFSNRIPVKKGFTEADKDLVNLIGSWISVMMERQLEADELKRAKEAADSANQAKSTFLANMSHEIRTPLTSIIGFSQAALDEDQTSEERIAALHTIRQSSDHLLNLINDILDFSKVEAGELDIDNDLVNPLQLVAEVESIIGAHAQKKGLAFGVDYVFPLPDAINSDPLRLKQILLNLCGNAIKFTDSGAVRIRLEYDGGQDVLRFIIQDTGIGMTAAQLQNLFKPFKQADASISRRFGGTGLGLSLSKRLAELLNCDLEVSSEHAAGSTFTLTMRLARPKGSKVSLINSLADVQTRERDMQSRMPVGKLSGNVLLAEDNQLIQQFVQKLLEKMGVTVTPAANGKIAVELAQNTQFDLIYMDMQMPEMSGIDAVRALRANNYAGPIVMLTANVTMEDRARCKDAGSNDFLAKPIDRQHLYKITEKYVKHR